MSDKPPVNMTSTEVRARLAEAGIDVTRRTVLRWADEGVFGKITHYPGPRGRGYLTVKRNGVERALAKMLAERVPA